MKIPEEISQRRQPDSGVLGINESSNEFMKQSLKEYLEDFIEKSLNILLEESLENIIEEFVKNQFIEEF